MILLLTRFLRTLPLKVRRVIGRVGGLIFSFVPTRERKIAKLQLTRIAKSDRPDKIIRANYSNLGQTALEALNLRPILAQRESMISCPDWPFFLSLVSGGKPILALSAHTGNWDLMAAYFISHGCNVSTIAKKAMNPTLQRVLEDIRTDYGINTIWRGALSEAKSVAKVFARNGMIAALIDQDLDTTSCFSPFFGILAKTPSTLIEIAQNYNAQIISVLNIRTKKGRYIIEIKPFRPELDLQGIIDEFNLRLQALIVRYPAQWVWFHKRWRSLPTGETMSSKAYLEYLEKLPL